MSIQLLQLERIGATDADTPGEFPKRRSSQAVMCSGDGEPVRLVKPFGQDIAAGTDDVGLAGGNPRRRCFAIPL